MKIITLNLWGGKIKKELFDFIEKSTADVFCFQEVFNSLSDKSLALKFINQSEVAGDLFQNIKKLRPDMEGYFQPTSNRAYGLAIFIKKSIKVIETRGVLIHDGSLHQADILADQQNRFLQIIRFSLNNSEYVIMNLHGHWTRDGLDNPYIINQTEKIIKEIDNFSTLPVILSGDFNLSPDSVSIKKLSKKLKNLILENNITSTRTKYCPYPIRFADYIFVNEKVEVKGFIVLPDNVSDHYPLLIEIN